jgi:hydroxypyruvate reductase
MIRDAQKLRQDALRIWQAGVDAVRPAALIPQFVAVEGDTLLLGEEEFSLRRIGKIAVVGAGKAGAEMTLALEQSLGNSVLQEKQVMGWVNVPADCIKPTRAIHLHPARPAGINEPTPEGVAGTEQILKIVDQLGPADLCIALISGGGSALLPAPVDGFSLADKLVLTREIAARGGNIVQLNTVRRELSRIKGGGLASHCRAGQLVSLILSDVLGDDLSLIASGPTVLRKPTPDAAIAVLHELRLAEHPAGRCAIEALQSPNRKDGSLACGVINIVIGNNATAVDAAGIEAERLGYSHAMISANGPEGPAETVARKMIDMARIMRKEPGPDCLITGGEPTVALCDAEERGLGGRNQQLALAALVQEPDWQDLALVSGGTDGEDGPTDAAGAFVDEAIVRNAQERGLDPDSYLRRNDAYHFFEQVEGLIKTGPTHTNVCDLRVVCVNNHRPTD